MNESRSSSTGRAFLERVKRESNTQERSSYLRPGLVSVSVVLVLGALTLDYRIKVKSVNRKRVNPKYSDAGYGVLLHHEFWKWISERRKHEVYTISAWQS